MTTRPPRRPRGLLTPRQREILTLLNDGLHPVAIAEELTLSVETVRSTLRDAYRRLGVSGGYQALYRACEQGVFAQRAPTRR